MFCSSEWRSSPFKRVYVLLQPSVATLLRVLLRCRDNTNQVSTLRLHAYIQKCGLEAHLSLGNYVVPMLVEAGCIHDAHQAFNRSILRTSRSWNALICGFIKHGKPEYALTLYEKMQAEQFSHPSSFAFVALLKACAILKEFDKGVGVHSEIARMGLLGNDLFVSSCLVDMYAKFGSLAMAQEVFDGLPHRDVVLWTILITCLLEFDSGEKALEYFERMQIESVSPDSSTFASTLKACGSARNLRKGREIHTKVAGVEPYEGNVFVGSTLVHMYAKCSSLASAQKVFDMLPLRNVVLWTALITGYAEEGSFEHAFKSFEQMQIEGVFPDEVTGICILKSCGILYDNEKCMDIHAEIERLGLRDKSFGIGSAIVDMYARTGVLPKAQEVFESLPGKNLDDWNALIAGYANHGYFFEAVKVFEQMELEGISPNVATYISLARAYSDIGDMDKVKQILADIQGKALSEVDAVTGSSVVDIYAKCGLITEARYVFDEIRDQNIVLWNALIAGYVENGYNEEALACFDRMQDQDVFPDDVTFIFCLKACANIGALDRVDGLHSEIKRLGLLDRDQVGNTLVFAFVKCGSLRKAQEAFDNLSDRNVISWTAIIAGHTEHGHGEEALKLLEQMQRNGVTPDCFTFMHGLKACGDVGAIDKAEEFYAEIERRGLLEESPVLGNSLLDMYAKCGLLARAQEVFDNLPLRDIVTWNTLIAAYAENGCGEEAIKYYEQMQLLGFSPDAITLVCCLKACGNIGARHKGCEIQAEIERQGLVERDHFVGSTLVDIYAKWGLLEKAQQVFDALPYRDVVSWNAVIGAYAQSGRAESVFWYFDRMVGDSIKPDPVTFVIILSTCRRTGQLIKSQTYFEAMSKDYGIFPNSEHQNCVVNVLGHAGHLDKAVAVIKKMSGCTSLKAWHTFMRACRDWGSVEFGREAFRDAVHLDEKNAVAYVMMSHIHAEASTPALLHTNLQNSRKSYNASA